MFNNIIKFKRILFLLHFKVNYSYLTTTPKQLALTRSLTHSLFLCLALSTKTISQLTTLPVSSFLNQCTIPREAVNLSWEANNQIGMHRRYVGTYIGTTYQLVLLAHYDEQNVAVVTVLFTQQRRRRPFAILLPL